MNDKLNLDVGQSAEAQSEAQPSERQAWTTPALTVIDISEDTESGGASKVDANTLS